MTPGVPAPAPMKMGTQIAQMLRNTDPHRSFFNFSNLRLSALQSASSAFYISFSE